MSKAYSMYRPDLADAAAVIAFVLANPTQFTIGTTITAADGAFCHVSAVGTAVDLTPAP